MCNHESQLEELAVLAYSTFLVAPEPDFFLSPCLVVSVWLTAENVCRKKSSRWLYSSEIIDLCSFVELPAQLTSTCSASRTAGGQSLVRKVTQDVPKILAVLAARQELKQISETLLIAR